MCIFLMSLVASPDDVQSGRVEAYQCLEIDNFN